MNRRRWIAHTLVVSMLACGGVLAGVTPASADIAPVPAIASGDQPTDQLTLMTAAVAEDARERVLKIAKTHPAAEVRVSAWNALRSSRGDEAITEWLAPGGGYDAAKQRARDTRARNRAFCERVLQTHTMEFSPEVHAAAERAVRGTAADQAAFVRTGYAEAQRRDRAARDADTRRKQEVTVKNRDFVRSIAEHDPGEQVRVAAQWALRPGATDADVTEFFGYGWATGATLDLEAHRMRIADSEVIRHVTLSHLVEAAAAAEDAVKTAADRARARAEAQRAWKTAAEYAGGARNAWLAEQEAAMAQAENWKNIAQASKESADELWKNIAEPARATQDTWAKEQAEAAGSVKFWTDMFNRAQDSENRFKS